MREFIYGLVIGLSVMWGYQRFDIPGIIDRLDSATEDAAKSTGNYKNKR